MHVATMAQESSCSATKCAGLADVQVQGIFQGLPDPLPSLAFPTSMVALLGLAMPAFGIVVAVACSRSARSNGTLPRPGAGSDTDHKDY